MESSFVSQLPILEAVLKFTFFGVALALVLCFYRVIKGPTLADRAIASDAIGVNVMALIVLYSILQDTVYYMSVTLVIAILGFLANVVLAKYIHYGSILGGMGNKRARVGKYVNHPINVDLLADEEAWEQSWFVHKVEHGKMRRKNTDNSENNDLDIEDEDIFGIGEEREDD